MEMNEVVILCGGAGTRLASVVPDTQKVLAKVHGVSVLDMIVEGLVAQGFSRLIFATGVRSDQVREHLKKMAVLEKCEAVVSEDPHPLGTGGAIRNAVPHIRSPHFLAINGDAFFKNIDFKSALRSHIEKKADVTLIAVRPRAEADYGAVEIAPDGRAHFREKEGVGYRMSAGAYWMDRAVIASLAKGAFSVEKDFFPRLASAGRLYGYVSDGTVHDIGTPERYRAANGQA